MIQTRMVYPTERPERWTPDTPPVLPPGAPAFVDCETTGLRWFDTDRPLGIAVRCAGQSYYLPFGHAGGGNLAEDTVREWARRELRDRQVVNLNTKFDLHMLRAWGVDLHAQGCTFRDVAHSAALLDDHRRGFSLKALAGDYLPASLRKLDMDHRDIAGLPAWEVAAYAKRDVEAAEGLMEAFAPLLRQQDLGRVQALEDAVIPVVVEMEHNGCPIDVETLARWLASSEAWLEAAAWEIYRKVGFTVNPDKTDDLVRLFTLRGKGGQWGVTAGGAPSFTADVMRQHAGDEVIAQVYKVGKMLDLRAKYLKPYTELQHNGSLYGSFHQLMTGEGGTVSGRFSSTRPNLQQVMTLGKQAKSYGDFGGETYPIRSLFRERTGTWFCADQAQVEFRIFAHYSQSPALIQAYADNPDTDAHEAVADMIRQKREGFPRNDAKNCNFARLYGSGVGNFAAMCGVEVSEAEEILDIYDRAFPEAKSLARRASKKAETRGYVHTLLGRRSRFKNGERSHKALNAVIQGSAADLNKLCLVALFKERVRLGLTMRLTVHDEVNGGLEDAAMASEALAVLNQQQIPLDVPILWAGGVGRNWAECK